ncbi:MAG: SGNH/GDSL hydrolase family protein [Rikenellaceae bacterium]|nr:SGNH/GDSL hydrolase family protein [Rikenellaceae bacterium]
MLISAQGSTILFWGDSITDGGWGRSGGSMASAEERNHTDLNHLYGHSYMLLAASELESRYPERGYQCFNRGISGYTLSDLTARWEKDVEALRPDVLSILVGTNDVARYLQGKQSAPFDIAGWEEAYRTLLRRARTLNPAMKIILGTPFVAHTGRLATTHDYEQRVQLIAACSEAVRRLAKEFDAEVVDYERLFAQLTTRYEVAGEHWIWDGIHPTAAGHRRMADLWLKTFRKF